MAAEVGTGNDGAQRTAASAGARTGTKISHAKRPDTAGPPRLRDDLTQTWNRAGILEILNREYARAGRHQYRIGVALVDLDDFRLINDRYGHQAGDHVLSVTAARMVHAIRPYDAVGRYGGEEFLVVIVENEPSAIARIVEQVRRGITAAPVSPVRGAPPVTASVGVARADPQQGGDPVRLLETAGEALRSAQRAGRNRVAILDVGHATAR